MNNKIKYLEIKKDLRIILLIILIFCLLPLSLTSEKQSQQTRAVSTNKEDSLKIYLLLAEKELERNPQKSLELGKKAQYIAENLREEKAKADAYIFIGESYEQLNEKDLALAYFKDALTIYSSLENRRGKAKSLNNIAIIHYKNQEVDSAITYYQKALAINRELSDTKEIAKSLNNIGTLLIYKSKFGEALRYVSELLQINLSLKNKNDIAETYGYLGYIHLKLGNFDASLDNYLKELRLREELNEREKMDKFLTNIGKIYYKINKLNKALEYFQKALEITIKSGNKIEIAQQMTNLGNVHYELHDYKKAMMYYHKSLDYADDNAINKELSENEKLSFLKGKAVLLNNLGLVYKNLGDYKKALDYCKKSIKIKEEVGDANNLYYPLTSIAEILMKLGMYEESQNYLFKALKIAEESKNLILQKEAHYLICEVFSSSGNYKNALEHHRLYTAIKDSLIQISRNKLIAEYQTKMETEKKEQENKALRQANTLQRNYFIIIFALVLITLAIIYNRYKSKQKANKLLSEKNAQIQQQHQELEYMFSKLQAKEQVLSEANATKDKFFSIIAHDLKNPLHAITLSSDLLMDKYEQMNNEQLISLIKNIHSAGEHLSSLLENLLQWSRTQNGKINFEPDTIDLFRIIEENIALLEVNAKKKNIILYSHIESETYAIGDSNMLKTVFRNLLSNAIKFSYPNSQVIIDIEDTNEYFYEISVIDKGIGINPEDIDKLFRIDVHYTTIGTSNEKGTGLGLILCKEFIELNGGKIFVESKINEGSKFIITLPKARFTKSHPKNSGKINISNY